MPSWHCEVLMHIPGTMLCWCLHMQVNDGKVWFIKFFAPWCGE